MSQPIESISTPAQRYSAALDSVNLISARIAAPQGNQMEEQRRKDIDRNVEHLKLAIVTGKQIGRAHV